MALSQIAPVRTWPPDLEGELFQAMLETASKADPLGINGRHGLAQYQELGYLSTDHHESVSHTLNYAYSDFCIASCAKTREHRNR